MDPFPPDVHLSGDMSNDPSPVSKAFGKRVRALRQARGLSQEAFADSAGLDRSYIGGVERGERNVSLNNIAKMAVALDIPLHELFRGIG